jgi:biotin synthase
MIAAGANVLMPNLTPMEFKQNYLLYPGKVCLREKGIRDITRLNHRMRPLNRGLSFARGDALRYPMHLTNMNTGKRK